MTDLVEPFMSFSQILLLFIFAPLWDRTLSTPSTARRKEAHQNALTSLAN
jgi:hypothetical protein